MLKHIKIVMNVLLYSAALLWGINVLAPFHTGASVAAEPVRNLPSVPKLERIQVEPNRIVMNSARDQQSIVVTAFFDDGSTRDVRADCKLDLGQQDLDSKDPVFAQVAETLLPRRDGKGHLNVEYLGVQDKVEVEVKGASVQPMVSFRNEVLPVLTKAGCNTGKCHGSASGKDGFRLSLYGFDPQGDHYRLTREISGRRIQLSKPESCLLVQKATGNVPHTGGQCMEEGTLLYETLVQWLYEGAKEDTADAVVPTGISVLPKNAVFTKPDGQQKLVVMATFSDGSQKDVTPLAVFLSNNDSAASVSVDGLVQANGPGAAFILARFDKFTQGASMVVRPGTPFAYPELESKGEIDSLVDQRLKFMHLKPSKLASDEQFLRRVTIDLIGQMPTEKEFNDFVADTSVDKRERCIDSLLERPEFRDIWVMKWAELLQIRTNNGVSSKALKLYDQWLRESVHAGATIDTIVRNLLPASGGSLENPATNYYQTETTPQLLAENIAQVFLGTRIQCAQCHNHPFDRWTMDDYYGFSAFFSQVGYKQAEDPRELTIYNAAEGEMLHPTGNRSVQPKFLGENTPPIQQGQDYRAVLAEWLASHKNEAFAKNLSNIIWAHFFGIGIVDPVDDMRISNPPSNPQLLEHLADRLVVHQFEIKGLIREICNSRTYQTSTQRNDSNRWDEREFSHQKIRRLRAEVLLDCITQVTQTSDRLPGLPAGSRAVQVADGAAANYFLTTFGRSNRSTPCTCEVKTSPTLSQALHLLNGETSGGKVAEGAVVAELLAEGKSSQQVMKSLYIRCLGRIPNDQETKSATEMLATYPDSKTGLEDLFWAILNSNEFVFNH
jgi:hypothetical protein